ncbi:jg7832 [Pararge aegeria aegeria]|uniref:Jg7832 protein n=1 Tax=Pararge aegeria aegeria TaxID=348720 RepID=A0A8S4RKB7_9NEOP|nr:jg7832 [Pararge aegeria aegeria]
MTFNEYHLVILIKYATLYSEWEDDELDITLGLLVALPIVVGFQISQRNMLTISSTSVVSAWVIYGQIKSSGLAAESLPEMLTSIAILRELLNHARNSDSSTDHIALSISR